MKNPKIIVLVLMLVALGVAAWFLSGTGSALNTSSDTRGVEGDPHEIITEYYQEWLTAAQSTSTTPYEVGLADKDYLSEEVRAQLAAAKDATDAIDPVLCQTENPEQIAVKKVFANDSSVGVLVIGRGAERARMTGQASVTLSGSEGKWMVSKIECLSGESAPEREYAFEREGYLLKSVPPPLNPENWHLVFEQNGEKGHTVPLFFDGESTCIALDTTETICDEGSFSDAQKALVQAKMTEAGAQVQRLTLMLEE